MILKFTVRNLAKRPFLNLIKVIGLSLALSGLLVIALYLKSELSYDSSHLKSDRIYRYSLTSENFFGGKHFARVYYAAYIPDMTEYYPEIESYVRLAPIRGGFIKKKEKFIEVNQAFQCDSTFLQIFDCDLLVGNSETILNDPGSMIISQSFAQKVYGDTNPVGQILSLPSGQFYTENTDFTIKGIMCDFPKNSHLHPDFITTPINKSVFDGWAWSYLLLSENGDPKNIETNFIDFYASLTGEKKEDLKVEAHLQNIKDIHLYSDKLREIETNGNTTVVYTLSLAALVLLFISLINYANLNIGMAGFTDKFMYINKISGSLDKVSFKHYLFEFILIFIATLFMSSFVVMILKSIIQSSFGFNILEDNIRLIIFVIAIFGLLSFFSSISPLFKQVIGKANSFLNITKDNLIKRKGISKGLIVMQYTISIALIIAVFVIHKQTKYAINNSLRGSSSNIICFENVHANIQKDFSLFKEELLKYNSIESVSAMFAPPGGEANDIFHFELEGYIPDETNSVDKMIGVFPCDYSFASIFNLKFISGKNFSEINVDDENAGEYIINEAALKRLQFLNPEDAIGKNFGLIFSYGDIKLPKGKIIGVVKNFHFSSLKKEIEPLVLFKRNDMWISNLIISFKQENEINALKSIKNVWNQLFENYQFEYEYVESMYKNVYKSELLQVKLLSGFTLIALFICSMGLLGMSLLVTQRRTKEIGIRKVNGAKIYQIMMLLNWDLVKWIVVSFIFAIPIAYFTMNKWLESYAYKISIDWWIYGFAGLFAILISFITASIISWMAAKSNPVKALRYE